MPGDEIFVQQNAQTETANTSIVFIFLQHHYDFGFSDDTTQGHKSWPSQGNK